VSRRAERVGDLLRADLFEVLRREVADPRVHLVTVSEVQVTADLRHAKVWVSILGSEAQRAEAFAALERASGFIRRQLGHRLRLRATPELTFELDDRAEHSQHISDLLEELHHDDEPT